jgi:hypothetical protein
MPIALRATITKLGPGIIAPSSSENRIANTAVDAVIGLSPPILNALDCGLNAACKTHDCIHDA